jgi:hypothetical protein
MDKVQFTPSKFRPCPDSTLNQNLVYFTRNIYQIGLASQIEPRHSKISEEKGKHRWILILPTGTGKSLACSFSPLFSPWTAACSAEETAASYMKKRVRIATGTQI